jgi:16S rRNA (guanine527-N7)-methyltransferase
MGLETPPGGWAVLIDRALDALWVQDIHPSDPKESLRSGEIIRGRIETIGRYLEELVTWNRRIRLTGARNADELVDLVLADAFVMALATDVASPSWVDIGAGAGAPGLILAMLRPDAQVTLVEPAQKRVAFLRTAVGRLGLAGVRVERARSDALLGASWDVASSRATLPPRDWLEEGARLARRAVWVLLAEQPPPILRGWTARLDVPYRWPLSGVPRRAVCYVPKGAVSAE